MNKLSIIIAASFFSFILWIIFLANTGGSSVLFDLVRAIPYGDKVGHFFLFGTLTMTFIIASRFTTFSLGGFDIYYGVVVVAIFVISEEISQAFIPSRTLDILDLLADAAGIILFTYTAHSLEKRLTIKKILI